MPESAALRPLPIPDEDSRPFWEGCRRGELLIQHCAECGRPRFHPRRMCPRCQSVRCDWVRASGNGVIFSRVVCHPPVLPAFEDRVPYAVVLVQLDEDPSLRLVGNVLDCPPEQVRIGRRVRVEFEEVSDEITLPQWRLVE